ncbi:response regulator transcription factor [Candidatus Riflebacteria bacterium]
MGHKILLLEDDEDLRLGLKDTLEYEGFEIFAVETIKEAENILFPRNDMNLGIFDIELPDGDGVDFMQVIREKNFNFPILFLTVRQREIDVVRALEKGGNDYLTKPYRIRELLARVNNLLKMQRKLTEEKTVTIGRLQINFSAKQAFEINSGKESTLTYKEWELLNYFYKNPNQVLSREQILWKIWQSREVEYNRTVDVHVGRLRKKIELNPQKPSLIKTAKGFGYRFNPGK